MWGLIQQFIVLVVFPLKNNHIINIEVIIDKNIGIIDKKVDPKYGRNIVLHIFASISVHLVEIYWFVQIKSQYVKKEVYCRSKKMCLEMEKAEMNIFDFFFQNVADGLGHFYLFFFFFFFRKYELKLTSKCYNQYIWINISIQIDLSYTSISV